ncbi:hypothetical protein [Umezawaea beigongshangensis]|uniref:hypothetical protein n=1 Tax=Umezawaea beigongshangensis TaxID=2780383 RepID=UPI0018F1A1C2|nr:hypothetical protein [Umezawaea beigongshangensis]
MVGPPPSQEHLDILAEIRALTESHLASVERSRNGRSTPAEVPGPAAPLDGQRLVR